MSHWTTTATPEQLAAWLRTRTRVVVLTHVKPDGDAIGSTLASVRALIRIGIDARAWYAGPMPDFYEQIAGRTPAHVLDQYGIPHEEPDGILIVDTGSWSQLEPFAPWLRERSGAAAITDHHVHGDGDITQRRYLSTESAAAAQPVGELCRVLLGVPTLDRLPRDIAEPLYLGLATDTGWFRHSNVTPAVMHMAGSLIAAGVDHARLYSLVQQQDKIARIRLLARALASLEVLNAGRVALMTVTQQDFRDCHGTPNDTGGFVDVPLTVAAIMVSVLVTESFTGPGDTQITKVSFRAKEGDDAVDVNAIARKLGGGGHIRAAGAKLNLPLAEATKRVIEALR
ncbi:MAG: DHH family phosphoesterase [Phycisphaerales bacterium]|nr:DHH family phosphoesterase [Phycisphaerales bacterium]